MTDTAQLCGTAENTHSKRTADHEVGSAMLNVALLSARYVSFHSRSYSMYAAACLGTNPVVPMTPTHKKKTELSSRLWAAYKL